ncbi:PREDICTED: neuronal acetylcholine receptor subunit alpha-2 [Rhagoletis zephyria]|uniref:neuronal acetylcholine receptor subunit alpha-2 n=1 Tax=Rhagoletis zephyria TaxID=28612 RepID=UPI000811448E|nr:PREDICTED: neuronal acetylcholine receptor subunit alpha-2 [Rhagoletis zephyria]
MCRSLLLGIFLFLQQSVSSQETITIGDKVWTATSQDRLRLQLLINYDKTSHPTYNNVPTNITLGMKVNYIDIHEINGKMVLHAWLKINWMDENRSWNIVDYDNLTQIHMKPKEVWKPDITVLNSAGDKSDYLGDTQILLAHDGSFLWVPPVVYTAYCSLNFRAWPYDTQTCKLKVGSLALTYIDSRYLDLKDSLDYSELVQSTEWEIVDCDTVYRKQDYYNYIEFTFKLQRRSSMYGAVIFTPASCIILLALSSFWLPPRMGEKILLNTIVIVLIAAFLIYFAQLLPILADNTPLVGLYIHMYINASPSQPVTHNPNEINMEQLTNIITGVVTNILRQEGRNLVQAALNPNANFTNITDVTIDSTLANNITELDKIPDVVRCLREFSGNPGEFNSWKKSVDRILQIYEPQKGTPKYYGILNVIRNKIVGNADIALESYNTPLDWKAISRCLTLHYADKRDLGTLEPPAQPPAKTQLPRPKPMDVDRSLHSKAVNYMNRPPLNNQAGKRPSNFSQQVPLKQQRNFHIEAGTQEDQYYLQDQQDQYYPQDQQDWDPTAEEYEAEIAKEEGGQSVQEYAEQNPSQDVQDHIDIHLLE